MAESSTQLRLSNQFGRPCQQPKTSRTGLFDERLAVYLTVIVNPYQKNESTAWFEAEIWELSVLISVLRVSGNQRCSLARLVGWDWKVRPLHLPHVDERARFRNIAALGSASGHSSIFMGRDTFDRDLVMYALSCVSPRVCSYVNEVQHYSNFLTPNQAATTLPYD